MSGFQNQHPAPPPAASGGTPAPVSDDEVSWEDYTHRLGPVAQDSNGNPYTLTITAADCTDEGCTRCYEPYLVAITPVDPCDVIGEPLPSVEFETRHLDGLIEALAGVRAHCRNT